MSLASLVSRYFKPSGVKWLHFKVFRTILVYPPFKNCFWHSGTPALKTERQSARIPNVKKLKRWVTPVWRWTLW